jgi:hypothetical protein
MDKPDLPGSFTADSVWLTDANLHNVIGELRSRCPTEQREEVLAGCISAFMRDHGASQEAIRFTRVAGGQTFATAFHKIGRVDVIEAANPFLANSNDQIYFVNGTPALINADEQAWKFDKSSHDARLIELREQCPQAYLKHLRGKWNEQPRKSGGQRFLQRFWISYPCPPYDAIATLAFDFDENGAFLGVTLVGASLARR